MRIRLATTVAAMMVTGCVVQPAPTSSEPLRATMAAMTPSPEVRESAAATEHAATVPNLCGRPGQLVPGGLARVNRDTVAHTGPGQHYVPTGAAVAVIPNPSGPPEPYRVMAGDRVVVEDGPLRIGKVDWFLVYSAEVRGEVSVGDIVPTSVQWVPTRDREGPLFEALDGSVRCRFLAAGGPGRSSLNIPSGQCPSAGPCPTAALAWIAAAPPGERCHLLLTDRDTGEVVIDVELSEWSSGASWWRDRGARLLVETDCTWSLRTAEV